MNIQKKASESKRKDTVDYENEHDGPLASTSSLNLIAAPGLIQKSQNGRDSIKSLTNQVSPILDDKYQTGIGVDDKTVENGK